MSNIMSIRKPLLRRRMLFISRSFRCWKSTTSTTPQNARINKIIAHLPRSLQPYMARLHDAPVSHVAAFLILHEITAIVPLVGLTELFHVTGWIPKEVAEGKYMSEGVERFGRYFKKKGWFGFGDRGDSVDGVTSGVMGPESSVEVMKGEEGGDASGVFGSGGKQFLVEVAAAYAVTKVLLPARIIVSVWATPWVARVLTSRMSGKFGKVFGRGGEKVLKAGGAAANGTVKGATGLGAGKG